jgi:hypothetical protein
VLVPRTVPRHPCLARRVPSPNVAERPATSSQGDCNFNWTDPASGPALLLLDALGWRIVSPAFDRERLITGTASGTIGGTVRLPCFDGPG